MSFKLVKRDYVILMLALHAAMLPLMVYLVDCVIQGAGILSGPLFYNFFQKYNFIFLTALLATYLVFYGKRLATILLIIHNSLGIWLLFQLYYDTNSKIAFFYASFNILVSIMFISLWFEERAAAAFNPRFSLKRLGVIGNRKLSIELFPEWGEELRGSLTSWSHSSFFIILDQKNIRILAGKVKFKIYFEGICYSGNGDVVSIFGQGLGVQVEREQNEALPFHWKDLYTIILDRGF